MVTAIPLTQRVAREHMADLQREARQRRRPSELPAIKPADGPRVRLRRLRQPTAVAAACPSHPQAGG
jgi:hypothetical protein